MSPLCGKDEREAAREAKESRRRQQAQALDEFINRAARAADAGDVSSEEQAIAGRLEMGQRE